ncbi:hypothetical protein CVT24_008051 [Panaeolus cyanescens]|uniref:Uncharacterized protein n=1 Tax=Panaeolus cyanescens TaxID=181874 RepID=A0A409YQQ8_9AGAR|nr:hypothetical protein CVT24_008051 [Panaeolus cyanescens]
MSAASDAPPAYDAKSLPGFQIASAPSAKNSDQEKHIQEIIKRVDEFEKQNPGVIAKNILDALKTVNIDAAEALIDLPKHVKSINTAFEDISHVLGRLDSKNYRKKKDDGSPDGDYIPKFQNDWNAIHAEFTKQLGKSREVATDSYQRAKEFRQMYVPMFKNDNVPLDAKKKELEHFMKKLETSQATAKDVCDGFMEIPRRIREIKSRIEYSLNDVNGNLEEKIARLRRDIEQLDEKLGKYEQVAKVATYVAAGGAVACVVGAAMTASVILAPFAVIPVVAGAIVGTVASLVAIGYATAGLVTEAEREDKVKELTQILKDKDEFVKLRGDVDKALQQCDSLCIRILAIASVWSLIRTQCQAIHGHMTTAQEGPTQYSFDPSMELAIQPYAELENLLFYYAANVAATDPGGK